MDTSHDPVGQALHDYARFGKADDLVVASDQGEDDLIPVAYFFRTFDEMPELEQEALALCSGKVLDVGAGGGCHSRYLIEKGLEVTAIDTSPGAVELLKNAGIHASCDTIFDLGDQTFDTIIILMNGIGLAGSMDQLGTFLARLKMLLTPGGKIVCDSTDIAYIYAEEDGSVLLDLNADYYGELRFNMKYKNYESGWFSWLYIDFENLA